jgi:hypothetical protein
MKRFCVALSLCVMLFSVVPAFGGQETALPSVVEGVVRNLDFFAQPRVLRGYENHFLYDVNRLDNERIGVVLISPLGFEVRSVYGVKTLDVLFLDTSVPEKQRCEAMRRESISVADAIKMVKSVMKY